MTNEVRSKRRRPIRGSSWCDTERGESMAGEGERSKLTASEGERSEVMAAEGERSKLMAAEISQIWGRLMARIAWEQGIAVVSPLLFVIVLIPYNITYILLTFNL
jgi:hypothetical protein